MVGATPVNVEPTSHLLNTDALLTPTDSITNTLASSHNDFCDPNNPLSLLNLPTVSPLPNCAPVNYCPIDDWLDISDSDLEKMLSPFSGSSDCSSDPSQSFDLESFIAS